MKKNENENSEMKSKKLPQSINIRFRTIVIIWIAVLAIIVALFVASEIATVELMKNQTYWIIALVISFASMVMTSMFSIAVMNHNAMTRELNETNRKMNDEVNSRAESFRTLQFIASNYATVDFVDYVFIFEESARYIDDLKKHRDFTLYMREDDVDLKDVTENINNYEFLTVRLPLQPNSFKAVSAIRFSRFKFTRSIQSQRGDGTKDYFNHRFVPCAGGPNALILYDENEKRPEATVNLIIKKTSEFYTSDIVIPFVKIKLNLTIFSLLGVATTGWTELYFTNPQKLEKGGGNKYKVNSSQFRISGLPVLQTSVEDDISQMTQEQGQKTN